MIYLFVCPTHLSFCSHRHHLFFLGNIVFVIECNCNLTFEPFWLIFECLFISFLEEIFIFKTRHNKRSVATIMVVLSPHLPQNWNVMKIICCKSTTSKVFQFRGN